MNKQLFKFYNDNKKLFIIIVLLIFGITICKNSNAETSYSPIVLSCKYIDGIEYSMDRTQHRLHRRDGLNDKDIILEIYENQNKIIFNDGNGRKEEYSNKNLPKEFVISSGIDIQKNLINFSMRRWTGDNYDIILTRSYSLNRFTGILTSEIDLEKFGLEVFRYQCSKKTNLF
jgi:hypothetical protein